MTDTDKILKLFGDPDGELLDRVLRLLNDVKYYNLVENPEEEIQQENENGYNQQ